MGLFSIRIDWCDPESTDDAFGPEAATWAELRILVGGKNITRSLPADFKEDDARGPVVGGMSGLAEWVVDNWKYILWETYCPFPKPAHSVGIEGQVRVPGLRDVLQSWQRFELDASNEEMAVWQHRHTFGHGDSDIALPSIVLMPETRHVGVAIDHPPTQYNPTVFFAAGIISDGPGQPTWVAREDLTEALADFVERTIRRAAESPDHERWANWLEARFRAEKQQAADSRTRRKLMLGDFVEEKLHQGNGALADLGAAFEGVLLDSRRVETEETWSTLEQSLKNALEGRDGDGRGDWRKFQRRDINRLLAPYEQGYRLAETTRSLLQEPVEPFSELGEPLRRLGVALAPTRGHALFRSAVVASRTGGASILHTEDHPGYSSVAATRFAIAAALGRLLAEGVDGDRASFGAAHGAHSRWVESQRANAFAAEFLLPQGALQRCSDPAELSERHGISRSAAAWHAHNRLEQ